MDIPGLKYKTRRRPLFDKEVRFSIRFGVVWIGKFCGIYNYDKELFTIEPFCSEISEHYSFYRLLKDTGERGLFDPLTGFVRWNPANKPA